MFELGLPCMRCGLIPWETVYDDGVTEFAVCKKCAEAMKESDERQAAS